MTREVIKKSDKNIIKASMADIFDQESIKLPPYAIIEKRDGYYNILKQYAPWSIALQNLAYRDVRTALFQIFTDQDVTSSDISEWVYNYTLNVSRQTGVVSRLDFLSYPWQLQILNDPSHRICVQKCTQVGISEICLRKGLWFIVTHHGTTMMITLPDEALANNFSDIRLEPLLDKSPRLSKLIGGTDSYGRKQIGDSWVLVQSSYTKRSAQSTPVDFLVVDEEDFSMPGVRTSLNERLSSSPHNYTIDISIPLSQGAGINRLWSNSTRNRWMIVCPFCSKLEVKMDEVKSLWEFQQWLQSQQLVRQYLSMDHIKQVGEKDYDYCCEICGNRLDRRIAHWEYSLAEVNSKTNGGAAEYWSGYKISQLCAPYISANAILQKKEDYTRGLFLGNEGEGDFNSYVLGEPPSVESADFRLPTSKDIEDVFLLYPSATHDISGRCSMGIDWGQRESWGVISKPVEYEGGTVVRTILMLVRATNADVMQQAREMLSYIERFCVGAVFADFGYGAAQNRILADALKANPYRFWEVVSSNPTYRQIQAQPRRVYQTRFDFANKQVHVMANTLMRRHMLHTINRLYYVMRQPVTLYSSWAEHHRNIILEKTRIPGSDLEIIGFSRNGPDHFCRAACYDLLAYEFLRSMERLGQTGGTSRSVLDVEVVTAGSRRVEMEEEEEEEIMIRRFTRRRRTEYW